ncbi:MAG: zinc-dependent peptidase, partial [Bacteroidetes bacterium]|nr:zinc-dependent peptidase [Bacteroidota bacterium]
LLMGLIVGGQALFGMSPERRPGYVDLTDGLNTGLHEMAHALINNFIRENFSFKFYDSYEVWEEIADSEIIKIRHKENKFLRPYAGTNTDELFAVAAEAFFEIPQEFEKQMPAMYEQLKVLFKQDPSNKAEPILN